MQTRTASGLQPSHIFNDRGLSQVQILTLSIAAIVFLTITTILATIIRRDYRNKAICSEMCDLTERWIYYQKSGPDKCMCKENGKWIHKADLPR